MKPLSRIEKLPTYVFTKVDQLKSEYLQRGIDIIDMSMGNPDGHTPAPIVEALIQAAKLPQTHRYVKPPKGIESFRSAVATWYEKNYGVNLEVDSEIVATIGAKEGISHLALAISEAHDCVLVPSPSYPIHTYAFLIAGAQVDTFSVQSEQKMLAEIKQKLESNPRIKAIMLNFPANPTGHCVEIGFFEEIIALAKHYQTWVIHDFAYADLCFDGYCAPSILQVKGAKDVAVEICSLSKSYNMPGWRVGYMAGNVNLISALTKIKSYYDYGIFAPIQMAAVEALLHGNEYRQSICDIYQQRRDVLCAGLQNIGWPVQAPKATMFVWAPIPERFSHLDSLEFTKILLDKAHMVVAPGIGFGEAGDHAVRFALIESPQRMVEAINRLDAFIRSTRAVDVKEKRIGAG